MGSQSRFKSASSMLWHRVSAKRHTQFKINAQKSTGIKKSKTRVQNNDEDLLESMADLEREAKDLREANNAKQTQKQILVVAVSFLFSFVVMCMFLMGKRRQTMDPHTESMASAVNIASTTAPSSV